MSDKIVEYEILSAYNSEELTRQVLTSLKDGWEPLGAPLVGHTLLYQAMIKYSPYV
jgi:hypothetical protein